MPFSLSFLSARPPNRPTDDRPCFSSTLSPPPISSGEWNEDGDCHCVRVPLLLLLLLRAAIRSHTFLDTSYQPTAGEGRGGGRRDSFSSSPSLSGCRGAKRGKGGGLLYQHCIQMTEFYSDDGGKEGFFFSPPHILPRRELSPRQGTKESILPPSLFYLLI